MDTYFIRHSSALDLSKEFLTSLWNDRRIAIHYPQDKSGQLLPEDSSSLNLDDYESRARRAMKALTELAHFGGYVCATYRGRDQFLVGKVEPGSKIDLLEGKWGDLKNNEGRKAIVKTLAIVSAIVLDEAKYVQLLVGRPRQGTIMRWPSIEKRVEDLYEGTKSPFGFQQLTPPELETLCAEFLRLPAATACGLPTLACLSLPAGSTLKDIDIYGITPAGKSLVAQVTYKGESEQEKIVPLRKFVDVGCETILFCQSDDFKIVDGIQFAPISLVVERFRETEIGKLWLAPHLSESTKLDRAL